MKYASLSCIAIPVLHQPADHSAAAATAAAAQQHDLRGSATDVKTSAMCFTSQEMTMGLGIEYEGRP